MRAVLDPGVLIAALISRAGTPARLLQAWRVGAFDLVVSPRLLQELETVLLRPKFRPYVSEAEAREYVALLARSASPADDPPAAAGLTADVGDDYLVALARSARARALVSGDRHLTELRDARPAVFTPRQFLELLEAAGG